ncbi:MAG: rhodanese-like domain-containing protein [Rickettsiales bacterium]|nr:rhodanese-like domain-containing protein [Rickettsiales bacterium]
MANIHNIDPATLKEWLDNKESVLIDVREVVEYQSCSIPNSTHLPLSQVSIDKTHLPVHKNKKLVFHCKSGKRSMMACEKLIKEGIDCDIWNLEGGIDNWKNFNFPTTSSKNILPLERQTQLGISVIILTGLLLYYISSNSYYLALPLLAGIGLLNAGLTGWCGLAKLMSKMPWNK